MGLVLAMVVLAVGLPLCVDWRSTKVFRFPRLYGVCLSVILDPTGSARVGLW